MKKPLTSSLRISILYISKIIFRHAPKSVQEKLISAYLWTLIVCWGHFSASLVAECLKRHKANISRQMKKGLALIFRNSKPPRDMSLVTVSSLPC
ncbi:MAG: hypothetical protein ACUBOA_01900 [Candidatus Loosdrechtia sp.]|uniref:hypothetical protein n=1 Tax=Candidatus Loosdrechtia sp. TaxID=3101272 RepID=UPI003A67C0C1|nr:MAG: hypothetical protein QY305_12880 [Candidatus Jettenia sp. AMX2]